MHLKMKILTLTLSCSMSMTVPIGNGSTRIDYGELILPCAGVERVFSEISIEEIDLGSYQIEPIIEQPIEAESIDIKSEAENFVIELTTAEQYMLAKMVKCEAGNQSHRTKLMIANTIYNRVLDDDFPNTIYEVIFQENQFSPIIDGSWYINEPADDEYDVIHEFMRDGHDYTAGALYFESTDAVNSWQSRTKQFTVSNDDMRFYK